MLTTLRIRNLALVEDLTLELPPGCIAITGETGAGKSILIGALSLVLGERADRNLVRAGSDNCSVEAVFDVARLRAPLKSYLEENGLEPCEESQLVLKRVFSLAGTNKQFINGSPTTLAVLAQLGEWLVDIHGPHDHQSLLQPSKQLAILDAFGGLLPLRDQFAELVRRRSALEAEKAALVVDEHTYLRELELLRHQVREIADARFQPDEEEQVEQEHRRASHAARLMELGQAAMNVLTESETSLMTQAGTLGRLLQEIQRTDDSARCLQAVHEQAVTALRDVQSDLSHYVDKLDLDPVRLQQLEERLNLIQSLKRKYGSTLADVIESGEQAKRKLQQLESRDAELARLNAELAKLDANLQRLGAQLTKERQAVIPKLTKAVVKQLADLGFKQSRFDVTLSAAQSPEPASPRSAPRTPHASGFDSVEFQFAPNPGEPPRPLRAIASSGEMARVMLALKTVLAAEDEIPVLIFDEVDANVGGETANAVGEKMRQIAKQRQVLCITHLAPVAAAAENHFVVTKLVKAGRTLSEITHVEAKDRVTELARMLGGQSEAVRKHAASLLRLMLALILTAAAGCGYPGPVRTLSSVQRSKTPATQTNSLQLLEASLRFGTPVIYIKAAMASTNPLPRLADESILASSTNTVFAEYDQRLVWGIRRCWYSMVDRANLPRENHTIVLQFRLHDDGKVTGMVVEQVREFPAYALCAKLAVELLAPFPPWTPAMRELAETYRDIRFTFHYFDAENSSQHRPPSIQKARQSNKYGLKLSGISGTSWNCAI